MNVFVSGGTGFVGTHLIKSLLAEGHRVTTTGTRKQCPIPPNDNLRYISADTTQPGDWQEAVAEADTVVNLAGRTIFHRWTRRYKKEIYNSRILTTRHIAAAIVPEKEATLCSTSAVGYYGNRGDAVLTENDPPGDDFLARLAVDWETEAMIAAQKGARVVIARFGVVLGPNGGAMKQMLPPFRLGLGGPVGNGRQWFPWIHLDDLLSAVSFVVATPEATGPINITAPDVVRNQTFVETLGRILNRPTVMPAPAMMLKLTLGEMSEVLLASQRAVPERLMKLGFRYEYPELPGALAQLTGA